ncbi:hypothetical protein HGRIS_004096 [Hohenbuehelia grisea]|uniref:Cytochrome P450 n=1 Tax=Hohenbuehelia grisea TaxID=104357 RepID=A0ABR3JHY5_9AGAR
MWAALVLAFLSLLAAVKLRRSSTKHGPSNVASLPSPSSSIAHWLFGHELLAFTHDATLMYSIWARALGPVYRIRASLFYPDVIVATDHAAVQRVFARATIYVKEPAWRQMIENWSGRGIVWAEGEEHARQRRLLTPAFTPEIVKGMAPDVIQCTEELESKLISHISQTPSQSTTIDIMHPVSACALDIFGRVGLCYDFQALHSTVLTPGPQPAVTAKAQTDATLIMGSWDELVNASLSFAAFVAKGVIRAFPFIMRLPLPVLRQQGTGNRVIQELGARLLDKGGDRKGRDIMSILLKAHDDSEAGDGGGLTRDQIIQNMSTLLMAGHETTAGSVTFIMYELARHPHVQAKLREEIRNGGNMTHDSIQKLQYLDAVIKEGFRLHPTSPVTERVALEDDILPLSKPIIGQDGTIVENIYISKGQAILIPFTTLNTNPLVWGSDGATFRPERWLKEGVENGGVPQPADRPNGWSGITTFCNGPRNCLGWRLGVFETKVIVATLVRSLEFRTTDDVVRTAISPTLQPIINGHGGIMPLRVSLA